MTSDLTAVRHRTVSAGRRTAWLATAAEPHTRSQVPGATPCAARRPRLKQVPNGGTRGLGCRAPGRACGDPEGCNGRAHQPASSLSPGRRRGRVDHSRTASARQPYPACSWTSAEAEGGGDATRRCRSVMKSAPSTARATSLRSLVHPARGRDRLARPAEAVDQGRLPLSDSRSLRSWEGCHSRSCLSSRHGARASTSPHAVDDLLRSEPVVSISTASPARAKRRGAGRVASVALLHRAAHVSACALRPPRSSSAPVAGPLGGIGRQEAFTGRRDETVPMSRLRRRIPLAIRPRCLSSEAARPALGGHCDSRR